jgi:type II secretory pathway pseudopilin PulG
LVVIAIIAILAAILFPVFAQAKTAAIHTQNISNIRQLGQAALMYVNDNEDTMPYQAWIGSPFETDEYQRMFQPYVKNWGIMYDPNRKLVWAVGQNSHVHVLHLDGKSLKRVEFR